MNARWFPTEWRFHLGLYLDWDYANQTIDISMSNYVAKALQRFDHIQPSIPQHLPHTCASPQYGAKVQLTLPPDNTPRLSVTQVTHLQQVISTFLYYSRTVSRALC
jgi:hypothetical protein